MCVRATEEYRKRRCAGRKEKGDRKTIQMEEKKKRQRGSGTAEVVVQLLG